MIKISLCMIVKNEEGCLGRCLDSVHDLVDEIIIIDTGSTDKTREIAENYNAQIYDFEWIKNFSAARNFSFEKATQDYIMWLDADDWLKPDDRKKLKRIKKTISKNTDAVICNYDYSQDEQGNTKLTLQRKRLLKRASNPVWRGAIHENVFVDGNNVITSDFTVTHGKMHGDSPQRNMDILEYVLSGVHTDRDIALMAHECYILGKFDECIEHIDKYLDKGVNDVNEFVRCCNEQANSYLAKGDPLSALKSFLRSFQAASPRPEACCGVGRYFMENYKYQDAIFWYELALQSAKQETGELRNENYYGFLPELSLASCYVIVGNPQKAWEHNELAGKYKPESEFYLSNKKIIEDALKGIPG